MIEVVLGLFRRVLSSIYCRLMSWREALYKSGFFRVVKVEMPVISIGNLTVGGTGKTPFIIWFLSELQKHHKGAAVVSRTYKSECKHFAQVKIDSVSHAARYFGDEPVLLAKKFPGVDFFVGPSKSQSVSLVAKMLKPQLIVVDDGFQHLALQRDLDVVLLDATQDLAEYQALPLGKARESLKSLERADLFVITKVNLTSKEQLAKVKAILPRHIPSFEMESALSGLTPLRFTQSTGDSGLAAIEAKAIKGKKVALVSGLGRPEQFEMLIAMYGAEIVMHQRWPDHFAYRQADLTILLESFRSSGAELLLTTAKDAVKIQELVPPPDLNIWIAELKFNPISKGLYEKISELVGY